MTALGDWPLFSTNAGDVTASASGVVSDLNDDASSDESSSSLDKSSVSSNESPTSPSESVSLSDQPADPFNLSTAADPTSHQPVTLAAQPSPVIDQPDSTMDHDDPPTPTPPNVGTNTPSVLPATTPVIDQSDSTMDRVDPPTPTLLEVGTGTPSVVPATTRSSPPSVPKLKRVATGRHPRAREGPPDSAPSNSATPSKGIDPRSPPVLADVKDAPEWMETKGIIDYFRNTFKLGKLPDVIENWYELERLLGFRKSVSISPFLWAVFIAHKI